MGPLTPETFWRRLQKTETCWLWQGATMNRGYGKTFRGGKSLLAHRVAFEFAVGPVPEGMHILHSCDVRLCCNPDHLRPGTQADNMRDVAERARGTRALTQLQIEEIRDALQTAKCGGVKALARQYNVSRSTIARWGKGKTT